MLSEWYNNGLAEAYILFRQTQPESLEVEEVKDEFEKLIKNGEKFEQFLDENKDVPLNNIKIQTERDGKTFDNVKWLFSLSSSTRRIIAKRGIWEGIGFRVVNKTKNCSICGSSGTKLNTALLFPFDRKVLNYYCGLDEGANRLRLCSLCQRICFYSFGNIFYSKSNDRVTIFFPNSDNYEKIAKLSTRLKQIRIQSIEKVWPFCNIRPEGIAAYYPSEFLLSILFALYRWSNEKEDKEILNVLEEVNIELVSYAAGRGLAIYDSYETLTKLDDIFRIFTQFEEKIILLKKSQELKEKEPLSPTVVFNWFFNSLTIEGKDYEAKNRLREDWTKTLLKKHKIDFITLNEVVMDNIKTKGYAYRFISFYNLMIKSILEGLNMVNEMKVFEHVNAIGYGLGKEAENLMGKSAQSALWDIFRTRTASDFVDALVKVQIKLRMSLDLREIEANKSRWREIRAILLNGMANALFRGGKKDVKSD